MGHIGEIGSGIEVEAPNAFGRVQLVHSVWAEPIDIVGMPSDHRIELCLLPLPAGARGCFPDRWGPRRFERIGELFLFPAGQAVHAKSDCERQSSVVCSLRPDAISAWFDGDLEWTDSRLERSLNIASPTIRSLLFRLGQEIRNPGFAGGTVLELITAQVAIELSRYCTAITDSRAIGGLSPWRLKRIDERLAENMAVPSLIELATLCNLSVRQLTRAFRSSRGYSIGTYIAERRIANAKRLLATDRCVKSIAQSLGFATPANFSTAFRLATGETPRQFRARS